MKRTAVATAAFVAVFAASVFSQTITATVPVKVNTPAIVSIQPAVPATGVAGETKALAANTETQFNLTLGGTSSVSHRGRVVGNAPVSIGYGRGSVSLKFHSEAYKNAQVSLFTINGKQVMHGKMSAEGGTNISRSNIAQGVYLLTVKGASGNTFTTKYNHTGGKLNITVANAFGTQTLAKQTADDYGKWTITATPTAGGGYKEKSYEFSPVEGNNPLQDIVLEQENDGECGYQTSFCGGMAYASVTHNTTTMPTSAGACIFISDFSKIQPNLNSTVAINGVENTCGSEWGEEEGKCPFNPKPAKVDGGYYVYLKTGTINSYENNGWQGVTAGTKNCDGSDEPDPCVANPNAPGCTVVNPGTCTPTQRSWSRVKYATHDGIDMVMNINLPSSGNGPWPIIMYIHGGVWQGTNGQPPAAGISGTSRAKPYASASITYMYARSTGSFPAAVEDVVAAVRFLRKNAATYCIDPDKIIAAGFSSGGYFANMAGALSAVDNHPFTNPSLGNSDVSGRVQAAVPVAGPSDLRQIGEGMHCTFNQNFFGFNMCQANATQQEVLRTSSPLEYITSAGCSKLPPIYLLHGTGDGTVPVSQSDIMNDKIENTCPGHNLVYVRTSRGHSDASTSEANDIFNWLDKIFYP